MELLFKLSKRFETGGGRWLKFALKKFQKKRMEPTSRKRPTGFPSTQTPLFVCMITTKTLLKWFQVSAFLMST